MTTLRRFSMNDLFKFNSINVDQLTETYQNQFYERYLASWSELCLTAEAPDGRPMGYGNSVPSIQHYIHINFFGDLGKQFSMDI